MAPRFGRSLDWVSKADIYTELESTQRIIEDHGGGLPTLYRAPYGMRWFGLRRAQRKLSLLGVMWTAIAHDWEWKVERVVAHLLRRSSPGGILCLHDGRETRPDPDISVTIQAVKLLVPQLQKLGYKFEIVSDLLDREPAHVVAHRRQPSGFKVI